MDAAIAFSAETGFFNGAEASIKLETISDASDWYIIYDKDPNQVWLSILNVICDL